MSKIYTKTGDSGKTSLSESERVTKDDLRIELIGELDEISSHLGVALSFDVPEGVRSDFHQIQNDIYKLSSSVAGFVDFDTFAAASRLEKQIDGYSDELPELKEFIAPGGASSAAHVYLARAVCRRAERRLVLLAKKHEELGDLITYVNRLSDFLFVMARYLNMKAEVQETVLKDI
jgi:cob(I)alamin adenosyltransferase